MPSEKNRKTFENSTIENEKVKIRTTNPELKDKIRTNVVSDEPILWYIRFNIPLEEKSVSKKTMNVTDTAGYIVETEISYDAVKNVIVIVPIDDYEENQYYLLNISKKVCSSRGQGLKREIHIMFKLMESRISEFKILKSNVKVPKPKPRPKDWRIVPKEKRETTAAKFYSFETLKKIEKTPLDRLPYNPPKMNFILAIIGILSTVIGTAVPFRPLIIFGIVASILGMLHIVFRLTGREQRSVLLYNRGVLEFNKENYRRAAQFFNKAAEFDVTNELNEYAASKVKFYLD